MHDGFHFHPHGLHGHNHKREAGQWQMPHLPAGAELPVFDQEADLDLVETSFVEGFQNSTDPTSFLRLANIPFVGLSVDGDKLHLLRVETADYADIGSVTPAFGGGAVLYDPLPAKLVQHRKTLSFIYHNGREQLRLSFAEARRLIDQSGASQIQLSDGNEER